MGNFFFSDVSFQLKFKCIHKCIHTMKIYRYLLNYVYILAAAANH